MKERELWPWLKRHLDATENQFHWQRIETYETGAGVPDLNIGHERGDVWVEGKVLCGVRVMHFQHEYTELQAAWAKKRLAVGGRVVIAALHETKRFLWVWEGVRAMELAREGPERCAPDHRFEAPWMNHEIFAAIMEGR